ncbi:hypothetical protein [Streptomyces sp. NPDC058542]|uniref:hypothetical protein n=1 Tax=Streptomyces sp. NPDC058542 TaxID=3346543 RepID=UPI00365B0361
MRALLRRLLVWRERTYVEARIRQPIGGGYAPAYVLRDGSVVERGMHVMVGEHGPETLHFPPSQARP